MVERFVELVGTKERLDALLPPHHRRHSGNVPKVWTPWKAGLLETLYKSAVERLNGSEAEKSVTSIIDDRRAGCGPCARRHGRYARKVLERTQPRLLHASFGRRNRLAC